MNNSEDDDATMSISKIFFFVISFFGLVPAIYHTIRGNQNVGEFINNNRNFSTFQLSMTLIATVISIGGVNLILNTSYNDGLSYFLVLVVSATISDMVMIMIMPRLKVFFYTKNFGKAMEALSGYHTMLIISILTCCVSMFLCIGQFKIGLSSAYFLNNEQKSIFLWLIGFSIACYIVRGGVKAVVKSDVIQLFIGLFGIIIAFFISISLMKSDNTPITPMYNIIISDINKIHFNRDLVDLFILFSIPTFSATYISRLFLAKDSKQMQVAFKWSIFSWIILTLTLYLLSKSINILTNNSYNNLNIEIIIKELSMLNPIVKMTLLLAWFMFAVTTIDSLVHFITIEFINILNITNENLISRLFTVLPFILLFIICFVAQFEAAWQINYTFIYSTMCELMLPVVAPIIFFYVIFQKKFNNSLFPILGIIMGYLITLCFKYIGLHGCLPSLIGFVSNLLILILFHNKSIIEEVKYA